MGTIFGKICVLFPRPWASRFRFQMRPFPTTPLTYFIQLVLGNPLALVQTTTPKHTTPKKAKQSKGLGLGHPGPDPLDRLRISGPAPKALTGKPGPDALDREIPHCNTRNPFSRRSKRALVTSQSSDSSQRHQKQPTNKPQYPQRASRLRAPAQRCNLPVKGAPPHLHGDCGKKRCLRECIERPQKLQGACLNCVSSASMLA